MGFSSKKKKNDRMRSVIKVAELQRKDRNEGKPPERQARNVKPFYCLVQIQKK